MSSLLDGSGFSGRIGEPEGTGKLLREPDVPRDIQDYVQTQITLQLGTSSGGSVNWIRANAAGTKIAGSSDTTVSRTSEGVYTINWTGASSEAYGVVVTPSTESGNGGDGVTPLKAYDSYAVQDTDDVLDDIFYESSTNSIYVIGSNNDKVWIHDLANFGTAATQVDPGSARIEVSPYAGCVSQEGGYVWISGDGSGTPASVRCMATSDNTITDFGTTSDYRVFAAQDATPSIWIYSGGNSYKYNPSIGGATLGSSVLTYTGLSVLSDGFAATWQGSNYFWVQQSSNFIQIAANTATFKNHAYPSATPNGETLGVSPGGSSRVAYDSVLRRFFVVLQGTTHAHLYQFQGWQDGISPSGVWSYIADLGSYGGGGADKAVSYSESSGVLFVSDYSNGRVMRFIGDPLELVDIVTLTSAGGADIGYNQKAPYTCYYDGVGNYGYIQVELSAQYYILRISYNGAEIANSGGASLISSALTAMYEITGNATFKAQLFRSLSPIIRADGEFTAVVTS